MHSRLFSFRIVLESKFSDKRHYQVIFVFFLDLFLVFICGSLLSFLFYRNDKTSLKEFFKTDLNEIEQAFYI